MRLGLAVLLLSLASTATGQPNSVSLCGVELRSGMAKSLVLAELGKRCQLAKTAPLDTWCVSGRDRCSNTVRFDNERLTQASRDISGNAVDQLAELISVLELIVKPEERLGAGDVRWTVLPAVVRASTTTYKDPEGRDWQVKGFEITYGNKTVFVNAYRPIGTHPKSSVPYITADEFMGASSRLCKRPIASLVDWTDLSGG